MKKKLVVYRWGSLSEPHLCNALQGLGIEFTDFQHPVADYHADSVFAKALIDKIHSYGAEGIISFDYFPIISMICEINNIPYISWIYDCPLYTLCSKTVRNSCNYIFCFDRKYCERLQELGAVNCYHYPLAGSKIMAERAARGRAAQETYDITFVGNLYNEKKNRFRQAAFSEYTAGYIDSVIQAQLLIYGCNFLKDVIPEQVAEEVLQKCQISLSSDYFFDGFQMAADVLGMEISARERERVLLTIGEKYPMQLYTASELPELFKNTKIEKKGYADYEKEVPLIFRNSKINLNITSKTIENGIPQRIFDILSCGGFCLTNYQPEVAEYFEEGTDLVMYYSMEDLMEKAAYYLEHDEERSRIADNGYRKVMEKFELCDRVLGMLKKVFENFEKN